MEGIFLPILVAVTVVLLFASAWQVFVTITGRNKRKLQQRLTTNGLHDQGSAVRKGITLHQETEEGLSSLLTQYSFFDNLSRMLRHAYPEMTLTKFVSIAVGIGFGVFLVMLAIVQQPL